MKLEHTGDSPSDPVIVIGNGMVGHRFCRSFRSLDASTPVIVLGREPEPAYDRVNLTRLVAEPRHESLYLDPTDWYTDSNIDLRLGTSVESVDVIARTVTTSTGETLSYGKLVVASGSSPWIPPIPGADGKGVFPYRTMGDIDNIRTAASAGKNAAVIGGGLLGLEAAEALQQLGLTVHVLEIADYLMPQQLDAEGGILLKEEISHRGIYVRTRCQTREIADQDGSKILRFADGSALQCDFVVISAGIRPETAFLTDAPLERNPLGAIVVNEGLETSDPHVYAIGECATFKGTIYGLVAPGYQMADTLARRLSGAKASFTGTDLSARLKVINVQVAALGDYHQAEADSETLVYSKVGARSNSSYRKLILSGRRLIGIMAVGQWDNLPAVENAMATELKLSRKQLLRFQATGELFTVSKDPAVLHWSPETKVCNCMMVKKATLLEAIEEGCRTVEALQSRTLAGTVCGSCKPVLGDLVGAPSLPVRIPASACVVLSCSVLALFGVCATVFAAPMAYADSVETYWYKVDQLWRDGVLKQISGYTLLALCLFALWISVQKRFEALKLGNYSVWRAIHTATGLLTLSLLFVHTGFHLGANFNSWLMLTFALLNLLGGVSGIFSALEAKTDTGIGTVSRRLKPVATWAHILLFWPIPVLVMFHIISVYYW